MQQAIMLNKTIVHYNKGNGAVVSAVVNRWGQLIRDFRQRKKANKNWQRRPREFVIFYISNLKHEWKITHENPASMCTYHNGKLSSIHKG